MFRDIIKVLSKDYSTFNFPTKILATVDALDDDLNIFAINSIFDLMKSFQSDIGDICYNLILKLIDFDVNSLFLYPVTDLVAPGYSSVISTPMDYYTIINKLLDNQYFRTQEITEDLSLIYRNCRKFNHLNPTILKICDELEIKTNSMFNASNFVQFRSNYSRILT